MATDSGPQPNAIVATTVSVDVLITETLFDLGVVTYAKAPFGVTATPQAGLPVATVATTVFVVVLITETLAEV